MASYESAKAVNLIAGEDLREDVYHLLTFENDSNVAKVIKAALATSLPIGVLAEDPASDVSTDGFAVPVVMLHGVVKVMTGVAVTAGQIAVADATMAGRCAGVDNIGSLANDQMGFGVFLRSFAANTVAEVYAYTVAAPHTA